MVIKRQKTQKMAMMAHATPPSLSKKTFVSALHKRSGTTFGDYPLVGVAISNNGSLNRGKP